MKDFHNFTVRKVRHNLNTRITSNGFSASEAKWGLSRDPEGSEKERKGGEGRETVPCLSENLK